MELLLLALLAPSLAVAAAPDGPAFFESRIRPLLAEHCYSCHSAQAEKLKGDLRVDSLESLLKGGEHGPALLPGDPDKSPMIQAVRSRNPDLQMPPKGKKLSARQIADLTHWVKIGAPWPTTHAMGTTTTRSSREISSEDKAWWAFQPIRRPVVPAALKGATHPIDAFVEHALAAQGLKPNPPASRRELIRRAYFDLIGLPPTPEQITAFDQDASPDAWPRLIDELLSRPQYGERWGRHWLDVVRFAQSSGYERDGEKPEAWRYRDYVVRAFNQDKPYDRFIKEQIAGDELEPVTTDGIVATGFQRLGVWDDEPDDKRMAEFDELDDVLATTGTTFLGLTIGCARCHEHKFDPIPQVDYYRLLAFFRNIRLNEAAKYSLDSANYVPLTEPGKVRAWKADQQSRLAPLQTQLAGLTNAEEKKALTKQIDGIKAAAPPFEWALAVRERGPKPPATHLLVRGNAGTPGAEVRPGFLSVLGEQVPSLPEVPPDATSTGRRRILAEWIASRDNPLSARVMVNRIWQHHFGRGIVQTTSDFGRAGLLPTHPTLLDWLAAEFIEQGWSIKKLHRTILLSQTYQRSSRTDNTRAVAADPGNDFFWRQNLRRLDAEALRDTMLAISGRLNQAMGGRGFFPRLSGEVLAGGSRPGLDWELSSLEERSRRSLYAYVRRSMMVPMLDTFDYSNTTSPLSERPTTTVSSQSLLLLNDEFMQDQAAALAERIEKEAGTRPEAFITRGFQLAIGRNPDKSERRLADDFMRRQEKAFASLRTRMTFRSDVPSSLSVGYMDLLKPELFLLGPDRGWSYHRGHWSGAYEGIRTVDRDRGPFALTQGSAFSNGVVEARVTLHIACESAGLFVRATTSNHEVRGYELTLEPREQRVRLRRHGPQASVLAEAPAFIPTGEPVRVKIEAQEEHFWVWLGASRQPLFDVADREPLWTPGQTGVRAWGAPVSIDDMVIRAEEQPVRALRDEHLPDPTQRARQAFALLLLNLNEVVYVD